MLSNTFDHKQTRLYEYVFTNDNNFCDSGQIMADADCHAYFYFTKRRNVFLTSQLEGEDTVSYLIGKYSVTSQGITCRFDREYTFYSGGSKGEKLIDPNNGKIKKRSSIEYKLGKLRCEHLDFSFVPEGNAHVLRKPDGPQSDYFFSVFNKIKVFAQY